MEAAFSFSKPETVECSIGNARGLRMRNVQIRHAALNQSFSVTTLSQRWSERGNEKKWVDKDVVLYPVTVNTTMRERDGW